MSTLNRRSCCVKLPPVNSLLTLVRNGLNLTGLAVMYVTISRPSAAETETVTGMHSGLYVTYL